MPKNYKLSPISLTVTYNLQNVADYVETKLEELNDTIATLLETGQELIRLAMIDRRDHLTAIFATLESWGKTVIKICKRTNHLPIWNPKAGTSRTGSFRRCVGIA